MIEETLEELKSSIGKAHEALRRDLSKLRTGRANPELLDSLRVDYYGTPTPIGQMATVSVPEPRMLAVKAWDKSAVKLIEKAILESDLGLNPQSDGELLRIPMPALTEERRKDIVKLARRAGEDCKVAIRKARHDAKDILDELQKEGEASEDDCDRGRKKLEEIVQGGQAKVDEIVSKKEADILAV
ncbi:MAG: ribosome recycling factor [Myxococcota bacterium]